MFYFQMRARECSLQFAVCSLQLNQKKYMLVVFFVNYCTYYTHGYDGSYSQQSDDDETSSTMHQNERKNNISYSRSTV